MGVGGGGAGGAADDRAVDVDADRAVGGGLAGGRVDAGEQVGPGGGQVEHHVLVDLAGVQSFADRLGGPQGPAARPAAGRLKAVLAEPAGEFAGAADRAQPALGLLPDRRGGDDEQPVAGLQDGGGRGDEAAAAADNEGQVHLGGEPELEDLHAVQPGPGGDLRLEQVGAEFFQRRGLHDDLDGLYWRDHAEPPSRPRQGGTLRQREHSDDDEDEVEQAGRAGHAGADRDGGQHDRHRPAQPGPGQERLLPPRQPQRQRGGEHRGGPGQEHQHEPDGDGGQDLGG